MAQVRISGIGSRAREGESSPADDGTYVIKLRGAGQGLKALVAEVIVGELGRAIGVRVPEMRAMSLDVRIARYEAEEEVQELLTASVGLSSNDF
ncbi:MAG: HipA family kinase [Actinomycetes bacterium]